MDGTLFLIEQLLKVVEIVFDIASNFVSLVAKMHLLFGEFYCLIDVGFVVFDELFFFFQNEFDILVMFFAQKVDVFLRRRLD